MSPRAPRSLAIALAVAGGLVTACAPQVAPPPAKTYVIGYLSSVTQAETAAQLDVFRSAMRDLGYVEGKNMTVLAKWADGFAERLPNLASDLVAQRPDILVAPLVAEALALKQATRVIPIVLAGAADPLENGVVSSLATPGGNITGAARRTAGIAQRRVQLLKEAVPALTRLGFLYDGTIVSQAKAYVEARDASPSLGIETVPFELRGPGDVATALAAAARARLDAFYVGGGPITRSQLTPIVDFVTANRLPSMFGSGRDPVDAGGLMFYGEDLNDGVRRSAAYIDKILRGAKPSDLPIDVTSKYDLVINMKTAKALGLAIPASVLAQATEQLH